VRVAAEAAGGDADQGQQFLRAGGAFAPGHPRPVRPEDIGELGAHGVHGVERVHGALEDRGDLLPAEGTQLPDRAASRDAAAAPTPVPEPAMLRRS
jgi:hypothetical protein